MTSPSPTRQFTPTTSQERFPALDGLRALAVTLVFVFHALPYSPAIGPRVQSWRDHLDLGVEIFFVLSGFLVYRPFAAAHLEGRSAPSLGDYVRRRGLRIYPAYMFALTAHVALNRDVVVGVGDYFAHLSLLHLYLPYERGFGIAQSWTLVTEVTYYALVPLWAVVVRRAAGRLGAAASEVAGAVSVIGAGVGLRQLQRYAGSPSLLPVSVGLPALGFGMLLAVASLRARAVPRSGERWERLTRAAAPWWVAAGAVYLWLALLPFDQDSPADRLRQDLVQAVVAALLVTPCVFLDWHQGLLRRVLGCRPLAYLALVSYGVYLWHPYLLHEIARRRPAGEGVFGGVVALGLAAAASLAAGALSWHLLERPVLRRARRPRPAGASTPASQAVARTP